MDKKPIEPPATDELSQAIDSLFQQCTVLGLGIGAMMKEISISNPEGAARIHADLFENLFPRLLDKLPDERARGLMDVLQTAIREVK
ncbi:hypothetical protein ACFIQG_21460 [Comamonas odontotermitis]|uniref:hypothetical protein n=1 Tax=Comamonas odontotermitis TaxID=379895 RepID=UPI00366D12F9